MAVRVKICGITRLQDLHAACDAGADALGFVFYEKSPRHLTIATAAALVRELPPFVQGVGLFVNAEPRSSNRSAGRRPALSMTRDASANARGRLLSRPCA
jgi:phosphoribosylanthranilate isomerase